MEHTIEDLPILEPLDTATESALASVDLRPESDFLRVLLSDDGESFYCIAFNGLTENGLDKLPPTVQSVRRRNGVENPSSIIQMEDGRQIHKLGSYVSLGVRDWFRRVPERKYLGARVEAKTNHWEVAGTDISALLIQHAWPKSNISFSDDAKVLFTFLLHRFYAQNLKASLQAKFKQDGSIPDAPSDFKDKKGFELAEYQRFALQLSLGGDLALFCEQGTGKTPIVIARICLEAKRAMAGLLVNPATGRREKHMYRAVLVVPRQVRRNWQKEFKKFATVSGKVTVMKGGPVTRVKLLTHALKTEANFAFSVVLVSYDTCANDIDTLRLIPWNIGVSDESHMFKGSYTRRWKVGMSQLRDSCQYHMILTGTPMANSIMDLWTQFEFLGSGLSGFKSNKEFRNFHGKYEDRGSSGSGNIQVLVGMENIALIQERLTRLTFRITKEEAGLNLPDKVSDIWEVEMTAKQKETYESLRDFLAAEIESGVSAGTMTIDHVLTKLLRLSQITSGYAKTDPEINLDTGDTIREGTLIHVATPNPKVDASVEMVLERDKNSKSIFWCTFVEDIKLLERAFKEAGIKTVSYYGATSDEDRDKAVEDFNNDPETKVFIANPKAAGAGLNLLGYEPGNEEQETFCDLVVFYSQSWSAVERSQAEDRAHRRGTKMPVTIRDLVVLNTIDEEIRDRVEDKRMRSDVIQDIRGMLKRVLSVDISKIGDHA